MLVTASDTKIGFEWVDETNDRQHSVLGRNRREIYREGSRPLIYYPLKPGINTIVSATLGAPTGAYAFLAGATTNIM